MRHAFSDAAQHAMEEGRQSHGKVLWLLAKACSLMLSPMSTNEPFKPMLVIAGQRTPIPDDFTEPDIAFFAQIVDQIDDSWLKARLADLVWLIQRPRDIRFALAAIDAYRSIPLNTDNWVQGGCACWERAIFLAKMVRDSAGARIDEMEAAIITVLNTADRGDGFLALWLADLLESNYLGKAERITIAQKLETLARQFDDVGDFHRAREFFAASARWFNVVGDKAKSAELTVRVAEGWVKEAEGRISSIKPSHMVAASFYENAIQTYRTIPRSERSNHSVDERIAELRTHLSETGEKSLSEMGVIGTPEMDISQIIENARNAVRGKSAVEALKSFANLNHGTRAKELRDSAIRNLGNHPLLALIPVAVMSRDGRVIAKRPGIILSGTPLDEDEIVIRSEMIRDYGIFVSIVVQGDILPALGVMLLEHRLREADFIGLAKQSPIVPKGRERLFGKALFSGYDRDFVTALHLLVPQIENMVRFHLKAAGVKTTNLDNDGVEKENGLSTLMDLPEVRIVFGEDLAFEIGALFCDPFGPNIRNELAHGLIDDESCQSMYSIYSWWFGLRLVFNAFYNRLNGQKDL